MLIFPEKGACFVCIPKTGTQSISQFLESNLRNSESRVFSVESLHDYHATLEEVELTGQVPFSLYDMWSFAFVRNPFDRLVSYCASMEPGFMDSPIETIQDVLYRLLSGEQNRWLLPQTYFTAGVKSVYRFEDFDEGMYAVAVRLGLANAKPPSKVNESNHLRYAAYYNADTKALLEAVYADDLKEFGYRF